MKRIINGKIYNSDTAQKIWQWDNGLNNNDFHNCEETLYRTKKGQYFIEGKGGALSSYSIPISSNGRGGGSALRLLTEAEALEWCEDHETYADVIGEYFEVEEG